MSKDRSYLELPDLPLVDLTSGLALSKILAAAKFGPISDSDKRDVIVLKEAFVLRDARKKKLGVFTRSSQDHSSKVGQCSTLLASNFDITSCRLLGDGHLIYNVSARLHPHVKEISGIFEEYRRKEVAGIFFHDKAKDKRYLFLVFELRCDSDALPLCYQLDSRAGDMFVGMRDITDVDRGLTLYNKTQFEIDKLVLSHAKKASSWFGGSPQIFQNLHVNLTAGSFTLIKINVFGA